MISPTDFAESSGLRLKIKAASALTTGAAQLVAPVGQRSGKSAVTSMASTYLIHRNLMLPQPWKAYNLMPDQIIDFCFVATTKQQSERTLWAQFKGLMTGSPWFKSYKEICDIEGKKNGADVTVKALETYISFGHKAVLIYFAANDPSQLRGSTRIGAAIDELSWFGNTDVGKRANGPETYAALNNSCLTLRGEFDDEVRANPNTTWPVPMLFNVSSPVSMDDPLMTLYRESADSPRSVRKHWATWEAHPKHTKEFLTRIGEMRKRTAERDYGAQPPLAHNPLIRRADIVTEAFKSPLALEDRYGPIIRPYALAYTEETDTPVGIRMSKMLTAGLVDPANVPLPNFDALKMLSEDTLEELGPYRTLFEDLVARPPPTRMHIMGVDLGATNNALGIVCGFLAGGGKFITDFAVEIKPHDNLTINTAEVYEKLIVPLVDQLNVADSLMLAARVEQGDCLFPCMEVGFMDLMVNKNLNPSDYPYTHLALQAATVRLSGNRLLKPLGRDDDVFRAWANAAVPALTNELVIDLLNQDVRAERRAGGGASNFHVSMGQVGRGIRPVADLSTGTFSSGGTADFPVIVRKGTFRS
jgi:hypothetical protein